MCVAIVLNSATPKDFWMILVLAVSSIIIMGVYAFCKLGAIIVNSIEVESDILIIKKIFKPERTISASEIKKYTIVLSIFYED